MKILAIEKASTGIDWENKNEILKAEARRVYELYREGAIKEIYFNNKHDVVLILECESMERATALLNSLPLVEEGLIVFETMTLTPYTGFDRIINRD